MRALAAGHRGGGLLTAGTRLGITPIEAASQNGFAEVVELLVAEGVPPPRKRVSGSADLAALTAADLAPMQPRELIEVLRQCDGAAVFDDCADQAALAARCMEYLLPKQAELHALGRAKAVLDALKDKAEAKKRAKAAKRGGQGQVYVPPAAQ